MAKTLSEDLRTRVIVVVGAGMSRRAAAQRFGVGVASAVRWVHEWRATAALCAKPKSGDQRSHRIEAYRPVILAAIESFTGALRLRGLTAPMVLDGPMNREAFRAYIEQVLVTTLVPDDVVIMDNLPAHRATCIREAI